jgi:adenosylcobinamide-GDP ribazoletransferase
MTRVPVPQPRVFDLSRAGLYLPLVGLPVWLLVAATAVAAHVVLRIPILVAGTVLIVQYFAFNLFHFDGLLDSADALLYKSDPRRRHEILKDHHIGSFALFAGVVYLVVKLGLLLAFARSAPALSLALLILAYPVTGRLAASIVPLIARPLRQEGLGAYFHRYFLWYLLLGGALCLAPVGFLAAAGAAPAAAGVALRLAAAGPWLPVAAAGTMPVVVALATAVFVSRAFRSRIGGMVGDGYGLAVELGELVHLSVMALLTIP